MRAIDGYFGITFVYVRVKEITAFIHAFVLAVYPIRAEIKQNVNLYLHIKKHGL